MQAASTVLGSILKPVFSLSSALPPFLSFLRQGVSFEMYSADYEKVRLGANILQTSINQNPDSSLFMAPLSTA